MDLKASRKEKLCKAEGRFSAFGQWKEDINLLDPQPILKLISCCFKSDLCMTQEHLLLCPGPHLMRINPMCLKCFQGVMPCP